MNETELKRVGIFRTGKNDKNSIPAFIDNITILIKHGIIIHQTKGNEHWKTLKIV